MKLTLEWFGVATYRLTVGDLVVFLDAYMDRVPAAPPVGLSARDVSTAHFILVGHSHFDHLAGAETLAVNTGATIIGSNETCRVMRERGVPRGQLLGSSGGERHRLNRDVRVRVFPGLHSCTWAGGFGGFADERSGLVGLCEDERASQPDGLTAQIARAAASGAAEGDAIREHIGSAAGSRHSGGPLVYLIETPVATILYQDTSGCWTGILRDLRPDVAVLAAAGRGNLDGEPYQGSLAQFVADEASLLRPSTIFICHHDDWMPPVTRDMTDITALREVLGGALPGATVNAPGYGEAVAIG